MSTLSNAVMPVKDHQWQDVRVFLKPVFWQCLIAICIGVKTKSSAARNQVLLFAKTKMFGVPDR